MKTFLTIIFIGLYCSSFSQDLPSSYYQRVNKKYEVDKLSSTTEFYLANNITDLDGYNYSSLGWNIDLFNINAYRGLVHNFFDVFRSVSFKGTLGGYGYLDYRSKVLVETENFKYKAKDVYSGFMPNVQFQIVIRVLNPINLRVSKGVGYNFQYHNYTIEKHLNLYRNLDAPIEPAINITQDKFAENKRDLQFFNRIAIFVPINSGKKYFELGVYDNEFFNKDYWHVYFSFGVTLK